MTTSLVPKMRTELDYRVEGEEVFFISKFFDSKDRLLSTVESKNETEFVLLHGKLQLTLMKQLGLARNLKIVNEDLAAYDWILKQSDLVKDLYFRERESMSIRPFQFQVKHGQA